VDYGNFYALRQSIHENPHFPVKDCTQLDPEKQFKDAKLEKLSLWLELPGPQNWDANFTSAQAISNKPTHFKVFKKIILHNSRIQSISYDDFYDQR
jgi:hypothetical protein